MGFGIAVLLSLAATLALLALFVVRSALFPAPSAPAQPRIEGIPALEVVQLGKRQSEAWWMPALDDADRAQPALVFFHGNGELIDHWVFEFQVPRRWGVGVLLVEYPGYGRSGGRPNERSISDTALAAYDFLAARREVDASRIVAYGRSLGGGAACAVARDRNVAALILESTFTRVRDLAAGFGVPSFLLLDRFDNERAVEAFDGPLLLVHGEHDELIPVAQAQRLLAAASKEPIEAGAEGGDRSRASAELLTLPCGHNDCPRPWQAIEAFLVRNELMAGAS